MDFDHKTVNYCGRNVQVPVPPYMYRKFSAQITEFRLLEVFQSTDESDPIKSRLRHYPLEDPPFYIALSYQWGDPSQWRVIDVDGTKYPVGLNLQDAMQQLRSRKCPLLWIDAICINQGDNAEKASHIPLMKDIYHGADHVVVWLGPASHGSDKAMQMLRSIDISCQPGKAGEAGPYTPSWQQLTQYRAELSAFLCRTFWERVWIIQEIASASRVTLLCGTASASWRGFEVLLPLLESEPDFNDSDLGHVKYLKESRDSVIDGRPVGFLQALHDTRTSKASVLQDKVFALVALTFDGSRYVNNPSYTWTAKQTCFELTRSALRTRKSLDIIFAGAPSMKILTSLPSWIPDYVHYGDGDFSNVLGNLSRYLSGEDERYRAGRLSRRWNATGGSTVTRDGFSILDHDRIRVSGFCFGSVNGLGATFQDDPVPSSSESLIKMLKTDVEVKKTDVKNLVTGKTEQLMKDLGGAYALYDKDYEAHRSEPSILWYVWHVGDAEVYHQNKTTEKLATRFEKICQWRKRNEAFVIRGQALKHRKIKPITDRWKSATTYAAIGVGVASTIVGVPIFPLGMLAAKQPPTDIVAALDNVQKLISEGLRLMTTEEDHIGWAHPAAELGDKLFLLRGCSMPAILRPSPVYDGTFTVVGHSYVQGVMKNEIWSNLRPEQLQDIVLS